MVGRIDNMAADYVLISQCQCCLNASHSNIARPPSSETTKHCCRRDNECRPSLSLQDGLLQSPVRCVSGQYPRLHNRPQLLQEQTSIDFAANMTLPRYMRQTIGSLQKAWVNRGVVSGRPTRTLNCFTYETDDTRQLEYEKSKKCPVNNLQLKPIEDPAEDNSGLTTFPRKGYGSLKNFYRAMYSLDMEDAALTMQPGSKSSVQYNAYRQPQRSTGAFIRHEPTERKSMPLLGSRYNVLENGTESPSFIGIFPLSGITYKLNSREIKPQKSSKQLLGTLESELGSQLNLRPMTCNSANLSTGNCNSAEFHRNHNLRSGLKVVRDALEAKGDGVADEGDVESRLFHVKIRTPREEEALGKIGRYHNSSAQTVRDQLKTSLHRPATSTSTRATHYQKSALSSRHNEAAIQQNVTKGQEIVHHRQEDKPFTEDTQLQQTTTNCEERETNSVFPESSAATAAAAVDLLRSSRSVVPIAPPLTSSPASTAVNALAAPSVVLLRPYHPIKAAPFINSSMLLSARIASGNPDKFRDRSARGRKAKVESENTTWLRVAKHSKSPHQRRKVRPVTAPATKRFSNGDRRQSVFASEDEDEQSSEKSEDIIDGSNDAILRQTLLERQEEAMKEKENSEEELQYKNERIFEWLLELNYSDPEPPPSPVIIEEMPMQTDTAIHIVYSGD